ncbi:MAG: DUF502 domain-containing protein [Syntrophorhabdaceae bacterium]|nr:DUF502 domain-containing protein [Syntrophorhabdaceae bacterium]
MMEKLKKSFITGLFVLLPLWLSTALISWLFGLIDGQFVPIIEGSFKRVFPNMPRIPGMGILTGLSIILALGLLVHNVVGKQILEGVERLIARVPGYREIYSTFKQLISALSSNNKASFTEVVLVEHPREGVYIVGFRTKIVEYNGRKYSLVYFATNHMYLGDLFLFPEDRVVRLDMPAEQAIRMLVSCGIASPSRFNRHPDADKEEFSIILPHSSQKQ